MIQVFTDPWLMDLIQIAAHITPDEREQIEAYNGETFDVERVALAHYMLKGPKWVIKSDGVPVGAGGYEPLTKGVYRDWALFAEQVWTDRRLWVPVTRICKRAADAMIESGAHRLECLSLASRIKAHEWCAILGLEKEGVQVGAAANGADLVVLSRVNKAARV